MSNVFQNPSWVTNESMRLLKNNLKFIRNINSDYSSEFTSTPKKGTTINVRVPTRYVGRSGETFSAEDHQEKTVAMTVQTTQGVDLQFTNNQLLFNLDKFSERVLAPAMHTLANKIETLAIAYAYKQVYNYVGTPGTIPSTLLTYSQARAKMAWEGAPEDDANALLVTPDMQAVITDAIKGLFHKGDQVDQAYSRGMMGVHAGATWYETQALVTHQVGPLGGTPVLSATPTDGAFTCTISGFSASAANRLKAGDIVSFSNCYAVNPWTRLTTNAPRTFVLASDVASDGSGNATLTFTQPFALTGPFQNINALPTNGTALTVFGAANTLTPQGLRFHRDAFLFASFDQPLPGGVEIARMATDPLTGIKLRFIRDWDTKNNQEINRFDVVFALGCAYPQLACRIAS